MYYNYIRFGSITEFGSNYQLTVNNMKKLKVTLSAGIVAGMQILFCFPQLSWNFPFIGKARIDLTYYSYLYKEDIVAGVVFLAPMALLSIALPLLKKHINLENKDDKDIYRHSVVMTIVALILAIIVPAMGGIVQRYACDFAYLFSIAGIIIFLLLYKNIKSEKIKNSVITVIFCLMIYTLFINMLSAIFVNANPPLIDRFPEVFYNLKYMFSFWE